MDNNLESNTPEETGLDTSSITRFEVIDHTKNGNGRILVVRNMKVELSLQDDGKTLKVFLTQ